ncbi:hypothetical protein V494_03618 [Pseudogymnoascus sp. VKM F-4513 (FW-928)]|nr:hypothetical protein V494_03618 [Pseudogymnoascus sp. VKM F-4513 (FW-928)]
MAALGSEGVVAIVALIISLVALLATTGQLLQQYFATADGYRRCQTSVMGGWGNKTRLRWRWREFRFETIYYVPSISILLASESLMEEFVKKSGKKYATETSIPAEKQRKRSVPDLDKTHVVTGWVVAENWWNSPEGRGYSEGGEMVCWVTLLERLRMAQAQMNIIYDPPKVFDSLSNPTGENSVIYQKPMLQCIKIHQRSWDFMPPDIVRPLCLSTVSDIATLAVRLGMEWKEFDPAQGNLRAEGCGNLIVSRMVRSVGTVLEYRVTDTIAQIARRVPDLVRSLYLPVLGVNDLLFGIVPGNVHLECYDRSIGSIENINKYLESIDDESTNDEDSDDSLQNILEAGMTTGKHRGWLPGFNDIISLTAPKMVSETSLLSKIPMPNIYHPGLLRTHDGLDAFSDLLKRYEKANLRDSSQLEEVRSWIHTLETVWELYWKSRDSGWAMPHRNNGTATTTSAPTTTFALTTSFSFNTTLALYKDYRTAVLKYFDLAEDYLRSINTSTDQDPESLPYSKLVDEHIRMAVRNSSSSHQHLVGIGGLYRSRYGVEMSLYWRDLPKVAERVAARTDWDKDQATVAWITMIFRAFCWHHLHRLVPTKYVLPAEWHGSQLPVYIG